eukprot:gene20009-21970_t
MFSRGSLLQTTVSLTRRVHQNRHWRPNSTYTVNKITKKIRVIKKNEANSNSQPTPLCVILGWGNSKQQHLRKYSEIYEERGFNTITVSPLLIDALVFPEIKGKKISYQVMKAILNEIKDETTPVIIHQFSNAGCALYYFICEERIKEDGILRHKLNLVGTIFDSCPVVPRFESITLAQKAFTNEVSSPALKIIVWYTLRVTLPFIVWLNPVVKFFMSFMENFPVLSPQLFLYSEKDELAPYKDIDKFIEYRKGNGVQTMAKCWTQSPHVQHFRNDKEGYIRMIDKFIKTLNL